MKIRISDIPQGKTVHDYPKGTIFVWNETRPEGILKDIRFTKDKIKISRADYRISDLIDYLEEHNLSEEDITIEELEKFRI